MRNLRWLGFRVPLAIVNKAHQANQLYPFAISLIESVKTYQRTLEKVRMKVTVLQSSIFNAFLKKLKIKEFFLNAVLKFQIEARITIVLLVAGLRKEVQNLIGEVRRHIFTLF